MKWPASSRKQSDIPARLTAPASGLYLEKVLYEGDKLPQNIEAVLRVK
jgi:hypothetical protein